MVIDDSRRRVSERRIFQRQNIPWILLSTNAIDLCINPILKSIALPYSADMTLDEKIRLGMVALTGASIVFASLGLRVGPLEIMGGFGTS